MKRQKNISSKPFPWKCPSCGKNAVQEADVDYSFSAQHDNKLVEVHVPHLIVPKCAECGELVFTRSANSQLAEELRRTLGVLQPEEIRDQLKEIGATQKQLAEEMNVSQ